MRRSGFIGKTLVHTGTGLVSIEAIEAGDLVMAQAAAGGECSSLPVTRILVYEQARVSCLDFWKTVEGWENGERGGLVLTDDQEFWDCSAQEWKAVTQLWGHFHLECLDGGSVECINRSPLYRTGVEGIAWLDGMVHSTRGSGLGRTIDTRGPRINFRYEMVPNGVCDTAQAE